MLIQGTRRLVLAACLLSAGLHGFVFWMIAPKKRVYDETPPATVVVDLLETKPGEPEKPKEFTPEGDPAAQRQSGAPPPPDRTPKEAQPQKPGKKPESAKLDTPGQNAKAEKESVEEMEPADPGFGQKSEATLNLNDSDRRYEGFLAEVRNEVGRHWNSRDALLSAQKSGSVTLRFTLKASGGGVEKVEVLKSSQSDALDGEAVRAVKASRLPSFPKHWKLTRLHLVAQFQYSIASGE